MANKDNVAVGKPRVGGAIHVAPSGTTLPTDASTALDAAFVNLGYVSEEGLTNSNSAASETIHAWGKDIIYTMDGDDETYSWTLLEVLDANVQKFIRGADNVTVDAESGAMSVQVRRPSERTQMEEHVIVVEMILHRRAVRHVIPRGVITEVGEVSYTDDNTVGYQVTVTALADASGNSHYEYTAAPVASSNSGSGSGSGSSGGSGGDSGSGAGG